MSGSNTVRMIRAYDQMGSVLMFLSGFFQSPPENFHSSEEVEIDIMRSDEDVAIVVTDLSTGYRMNSSDLYTNKKFKPPVYKEGIPLNAFDLLKRQPGVDPFETPQFRANISSQMMRGMRLNEDKIMRARELQASQILQTGVLTLTDTNGAALYTLDYKPKASHFPTVATAWNDPAATPLQDLAALAQQIRNDGLASPDLLIMGSAAYTNFIQNAAVLTALDNRRLNVGDIGPMEMRGEGGQFRGMVDIDNYKFQIWTYDNRYNDPTNPATKLTFVDPNKVIMMNTNIRLDATFGAIPNIGRELGVTGTALLPELPGRFAVGGNSRDLWTNVWLSPDGEQLFGGVGARQLLIPTAIDQYGCLTTTV